MTNDTLVVGAGSIGTLISLALYRAGVEPDILTRSKVSSKCELVGEEGEEFRPRIYYLDNLPRKKYDLIFLCVKAYQVANVIPILEMLFTGEGAIVSLQNGLGIYEALMGRFGGESVVAGVVTYGSTRLEPCRARLTGRGTIYLGGSERARELSDVLSRGGLDTRYVEDIDGYRWWKTLVNAGINPVTVVYQAPNRVVVEVEEANWLAHEAVEEGLEVARSLGIEMPMDPHKSLDEVARRTGENLSSMLQDILRGSMTEIDFINGALVKYGLEMGINTPVNYLLYNIVKGLERWRGVKQS